MYVTLDHVIAVAKTVVKDADNIEMNLYKEWVGYALPYLGIADDELDVAELEPQNLIAKLPDNCRLIYELSLFDTAGCQIAHKFRTGKTRIFTDVRSSRVATGSGQNINNYIPVDVSNDRFNLILGTNGALVGKILIRYFKRPIDENGLLVIREEEVMACVHYIKFMKAWRDDEIQSKIQQYNELWKIEADRVKASKKMNSMTPEKAKTIGAEMMRLIPQFNQSTF